MFNAKIARAIQVSIGVAVLAVVPAFLQGQVTSSGDVPIQNSAMPAAQVPPGVASTMVSFVADPTAGGGDQFDVAVDNPQVVIGLIVPGDWH